MAVTKRAGRTANRSPKRQWELSDRTKKILIITTASIVVIIGGIWAFDVLVAPAKPDLAVAKETQVAEYLGHPKGFARLPVEQREQFLVDVIQRCDTPERVEAMSRAMRQMSFGERQQFLDATFEIGKDKFVKASEDYLKTPKAERQRYVDGVLANFDRMRQQLAGPAPAQTTARRGGGGPGPAGAAGAPGPVAVNRGELASPFKDHIPQKSDAFTKMIVDRTTPSERAKAKPLVDDIAQRLDQRKQQERAMGGRRG